MNPDGDNTRPDQHRQKGNGHLETRIAVLETRSETYATRENALEHQKEIADKLVDMHKEIASLWWKMGGILVAIAAAIIAALKLL